jgi:hypothetical protein
MTEYGIPTVGPRGIQFRSRIEAQWAHVFDALGWKWDYEPIDLRGYIPDFIVRFANGVQLLVEVKGSVDIWGEATPHIEKIRKSGWEGPFLVVGSNFISLPELGHFYGHIDIGVGGMGMAHKDDVELKKKGGVWSLGCKCKGQWETGWYPEGAHDVEYCENGGVDAFQAIWTAAKNRVQWRAPVAPAPKAKRRKSHAVRYVWNGERWAPIIGNSWHPIVEPNTPKWNAYRAVAAAVAGQENRA